MNNKEKADLFMQYFSENYDKSKLIIANQMRDWSFKQNQKYPFDADEMFHTSLLKCYERILKKGFEFIGGISLSAVSIMNLMYYSIRGEYWAHCKSQSRLKRMGEINEEENRLGEILEHVFIHDDEVIKEGQDKHIKEETLVWEIFDYVDKNYNGVTGGLFKFYFKTMLTFSQLEILTNYSRSFIYQNVTTVKKDVIQKFNYGKAKEQSNYRNKRRRD